MRSGPPDAPPGQSRPIVRDCSMLLVGAFGPVAAAFVLIPAGRAAAWVGLLVTIMALSRFAGRDAGIVAGLSAALLFMWVHGPDRFAGTITDPWVIRFGFLLGLTGALAAMLADRWHRHARRATPRAAAAVRADVARGCRPSAL